MEENKLSSDIVQLNGLPIRFRYYPPGAYWKYRAEVGPFPDSMIFQGNGKTLDEALSNLEKQVNNVDK